MPAFHISANTGLTLTVRVDHGQPCGPGSRFSWGGRVPRPWSPVGKIPVKVTITNHHGEERASTSLTLVPHLVPRGSRREVGLHPQSRGVTAPGSPSLSAPLLLLGPLLAPCLCAAWAAAGGGQVVLSRGRAADVGKHLV